MTTIDYIIGTGGWTAFVVALYIMWYNKKREKKLNQLWDDITQKIKEFQTKKGE